MDHATSVGKRHLMEEDWSHDIPSLSDPLPQGPADGWSIVSAVYNGFSALAIVAGLLHLVLYRRRSHHLGSNSHSPVTETQAHGNVKIEHFHTFQRNFCVVFILALFGDGLQGPYIYKLYEHYGFQEFQIAQLYVVGFASSVIFGTLTGPMADSMGRKKMCQFFCLSYILCCLTKFSHNFWVLWWGRICGGVSTSILYSTFEAWYVYEHMTHHAFPGDWVGQTFSITTFWNGLLAITAGVIANSTAVAMGFGPVAPFAVAIIPFLICGVIMTQTWPENYGQRSENVLKLSRAGLKIVWENAHILTLGGIQTMVESIMYIFVYLWTPVLDATGEEPPLGIIFSCFMVALMIGSNLYTLLSSSGWRADEILQLCLVILMACMGVCSVVGGPQSSNADLILLFVTFLCLEVAIGLYFPAMSQCRAQVIPESHRANVMNLFRVPLNTITCVTLLLIHVDAIALDKRFVFQACLGLGTLGLVLARRFTVIMRRQDLFAKEEQCLAVA
eukprot:snap_masked-scaffold1595_size34508-processed-gene-0.3 protein:Tk09499 transcript:snap_masked-scaffold1595_size34508-processed-gene-0.3-mRNA-1 annotation:"hypothetical protein DAPPUDRAFT_321809"